MQNILKHLAAKRQRNREEAKSQKNPNNKKSGGASKGASSGGAKRPRNGTDKPLGFIEEKESSSFISKNYGVKVYDLEGKKSLQQILENSKLKARYNEDAKNYTTLIDDLEFPVATNSIRLTADENHLWATGVYPPQVKCFVLDDLTMKFQRNCDSEVVKILPLSTDYRKVALMQADRHIEIHAQFGTYYRFRIPRVGRDITYHAPSCEMLVCGSSSEVYRFNLEQGMFRKPIKTYSPGCEAINSIKINPIHQLIGIGCDNGWVECIDPRSKSTAGILNVCDYIKQSSGVKGCGDEVTCFEFDSNGVTFAAGTNKGQVGIFDLRKSGIIHTKDHNYDLPIVSMGFHDLTKNIFTADKKVVKVWNKETGSILTNLEMPAHISDAIMIPSSGMMMIAGERSKIKPLYIPALGPAPKWCSFVDTITEELEEIKKFSVYQDLKYVTVEELQELGMQDLLGTDLLRPHLHGFFIKMSLYKKALEFYKKSNQTSEEDASKIEDKEGGINRKTDDEIEQETNKLLRQNRVDKLMAYLNDEEAPATSKKTKAMKTNDKAKEETKDKENKINTVGDDRFAGMFDDPEYAQDDDEATRVKKRQKTKNKKADKDQVSIHALEPGQSISYKDSDMQLKPSELAREKNKPLAERIADSSKKTKDFSISNIRGNKEITFHDESDDDDSGDENVSRSRKAAESGSDDEEPEKPTRRKLPNQFLKRMPKKKGFKPRSK